MSYELNKTQYTELCNLSKGNIHTALSLLNKTVAEMNSHITYLGLAGSSAPKENILAIRDQHLSRLKLIHEKFQKAKDLL